MTSGGYEVEVVRGGLSDARAEQLLQLWSTHGVLDGDAARERLTKIVCILVDGSDAVVGACSVFDERVRAIGNRRFWVYRRFLAPGVDAASTALLFNRAFDVLEAAHTATVDEPIGLCVLVNADAPMQREAMWSDTGLRLSGYLPDGRQVRVRYFSGALVIEPLAGDPHGAIDDPEHWLDPYPLAERHSVRAYVAGDAELDAQLLAMWRREGAITGERAQRRLRQVLMVAIDEQDGVVGAMTAFLTHNEQLRLDLWHVRAFVAAAHRRSNLVVHLTVAGNERLLDRFLSGADTRAIGVAAEVEHDGLKRHFPTAVWPFRHGEFVGENHRHDHVYVRWFPGAQIPAR